MTLSLRCPYCSTDLRPDEPAVGTTYRGGRRWLPQVRDTHHGGPDFYIHPHCYAEQHGEAELDAVRGLQGPDPQA
ncbi:hypothetical protein ABT095_12180 [Kitasatospora sp. NPDC002227]|uniref:hypothetical protein n=1 Tax=Kitasatospora sp. NPDC002227 TaxID=3154773 RepID=UPI00331D23D2